MRKKSQKVICALLLIVMTALAIGCAVKDHDPTPEEIAAAETTARLKETTAQETTEEVTENNADHYDFINEMPDVYEDYQAPEPEAQEEPEAEEEEVYTAPDKWAEGRYQFTSDELWEMTRITYLENGITWPECTEKTIFLTACVILNRLYDWDECGTVYEVIWQTGQYSTADRYHDYDGSELGTSNPDGWEMSRQAVLEAIENRDTAPHFQSMGAQGEVYYQDPYTGETFCY